MLLSLSIWVFRLNRKLAKHKQIIFCSKSSLSINLTNVLLIFSYHSPHKASALLSQTMFHRHWIPPNPYTLSPFSIYNMERLSQFYSYTKFQFKNYVKQIFTKCLLKHSILNKSYWFKKICFVWSINSCIKSPVVSEYLIKISHVILVLAKEKKQIMLTSVYHCK